MVLKEPVTKVRGQSRPQAAAQSAVALEGRLRNHPDDWKSRLALAQVRNAEGDGVVALEHLKKASELAPQSADIEFTMGLVYLGQGNRESGLKHLKAARDMDPSNWRIRKQIWAIENPDKFYEKRSPDYDWQNEQLKREKAK